MRLGAGKVNFDTWKAEHLRPRAVDDPQHGVSAGEGNSRSGANEALALGTPCTLHMVPCPRRGGLDLQLQLVSLQVGCPGHAGANGGGRLPGTHWLGALQGRAELN